MYEKKIIEILDYHHSMVFDHNRTDSYLRAIMQTVKLVLVRAYWPYLPAWQALDTSTL